MVCVSHIQVGFLAEREVTNAMFILVGLLDSIVLRLNVVYVFNRSRETY